MLRCTFLTEFCGGILTYSRTSPPVPPNLGYCEDIAKYNGWAVFSQKPPNPRKNCNRIHIYLFTLSFLYQGIKAILYIYLLLFYGCLGVFRLQCLWLSHFLNPQVSPRKPPCGELEGFPITLCCYNAVMQYMDNIHHWFQIYTKHFLQIKITEWFGIY